MTRRFPRDTISTSFQGRPRPGDELGGKYRIERELGSGGMGVVYEVTHLAMPQARFAIKWLQPFVDEDALRRFRREARISGAIRHRHVIEVYDVNLDDGGSYLVMELLEGETLAARIERERGLRPTDACTIISQCLSGVAAAHAAGVIHRDIKPANIFLCSSASDTAVHPKVLDFGVSRVLSGFPATDTLLTHGAMVGTPAYMAPEQLQAEDCDSRIDIYAMGVTLYEALAGERAFDAASYADLVVRIVTGNVKPLRQVVAGLPAGLSDVVMRAMHRDPKRRYASVASFAAALEPYLLPVSTPGAGAQRKAAPRALRTGWHSVALGAGAIAVGAAALVSAGFGRGSEAPSSRELGAAGQTVPWHAPAPSLAGSEPTGSSQPDDASRERAAREHVFDGDLVNVDDVSRVVSDEVALRSAPSKILAPGTRKSVATAAPRRSAKPQQSLLAEAQPRMADAAETFAGPQSPEGRVAKPEALGPGNGIGETSARARPQPPPLEAPTTAAEASAESPGLGRQAHPRPRPPLTLESL